MEPIGTRAATGSTPAVWQGRGLYQHHKGGWYLALSLLKNSENAKGGASAGALAVLYYSLGRHKLHVRPLPEFIELVPWPSLAGKPFPRFTKRSLLLLPDALAGLPKEHRTEEKKPDQPSAEPQAELPSGVASEQG